MRSKATMTKPRYYEVTDLKKVVCSTQRAGSNSIAEALRPRYNDSPANEITADEALARRKEGWPVLLWMRDPFDKFASAYRIFGRPSKKPPQTQQVHDKSPKGFATAVLKKDDAHWAPQTRTHTHGGVFLPTKVMPFSDIAATWAAELPGYNLGHKNKTARRDTFADLTADMPAATVARLRKHFRADTQMLESLT